MKKINILLNNRKIVDLTKVSDHFSNRKTNIKQKYFYAIPKNLIIYFKHIPIFIRFVEMILTAEKISELVDGEVIGNPNTKVNNVSKIEDAKNGDISFLANPKYTEFIYSTNASIIIVSDMFFSDRKINKTLIKVKDPYIHLVKL